MQGSRIVRVGAAGLMGLYLSVSVASASPPQTQPGVGLASTADGPIAGADHQMQIEPLRKNQMQAADALGLTSTPRITPWEQITVRRGDTLSGIFARAGLSTRAWSRLLRLDGTQALDHLRPGQTLHIRKTPRGELGELRFKLDAVHTLAVSREQGQLRSRVDARPTQKRQITASGTVDGSLSESLANEAVPDKIADQLVSIYHYRHDLNKLDQGDEFSVIYTATYADSEEIGIGSVVAAQITTNHRIYRAFRAEGYDGEPAYFDGTGKSYKPAFTRKPVAYTRISSPFNMHRLHPITHRVVPHEGVDLAAPTGTPVHAAADGVITYAGWMKGYGRLIKLRNMDGYSTRYAHMHKLHRGLQVGDRVAKGDVIGYVGETGRATGPHLHFEIRHNGRPENPMTVKLPGGHDLPTQRLARYKRRIQPLVARLSPAPTTLLAKTASTPSNGETCLGRNGFQNRLSSDDGKRSDGILCLVRDPSDNV